MRPPARNAGLVRTIAERPLLAALLIVGLSCLLTVLAVPPVYFTNDDLMLNLLAAGVGVTDASDVHLLFTSVLIGNLLAWLYTLLPSVPWYPLYLNVSTWLACSALLYVLLLRVSVSRALVFICLYFGLFGVMLFSRMQFTITAMQCGLAGFALLHHAWEQESGNGKREILITIAGIGMLVLAAAIRIHVILWMTILVLPLITVCFWTTEIAGRVKLASLGAACITLWAAVYLIDYKAYQDDPQWKQFQEINSLRSSFNDYRQVRYSDGLKPVFESEGWDRLDFEMINEWFYADEKKYDVETLRRIVGKFPAWKQDVSWSEINLVLLQAATAPVALAAVVFIAWMLIAGNVRRQGKMVVLGMIATIILAIPLMHILAKAPPAYLLWPSMAFIAYWPLHWMRDEIGQNRAADGRGGVIVKTGAFIFALCGLLTYAIAIYDTRNLKVTKEYVTSILQRGSGASASIYVIWGNSLPTALVPAYQWGETLRGVDLIWIGASLHSPVTKQQLTRLHIQDLYTSLYERSDLLLLNSKPSRERLLAEFELSRYGVPVKFTQTGNQYGLRSLKVSRQTAQSKGGISK